MGQHLVFREILPASGALVFTPRPIPIGDHVASLAGSIEPPAAVDLSMLLTGPVVAGWDINVWRGLSASTRLPFGHGQPVGMAARIALSKGAKAFQDFDLAIAPGSRFSPGVRLAYGVTQPIFNPGRIAIQPTLARMNESIGTAWNRTGRIRQDGRLNAAMAAPILANIRAVWVVTQRARQTANLVMGVAAPFCLAWRMLFGKGHRLFRHNDLWFGRGRFPAWGVHPVPPIIPVEPDIFRGNPHLVFKQRLPFLPHLVFRRSLVVIVLPTGEFHLVANQAYVKRVDNNQPIECKSVKISGDCDSWSRRISGEAFWTERSKLELAGGPVEIEIGANGVVWRALVRSTRDNRQFGAESISFEALSKSAVLASPIAAASSRINIDPANAQQLALAELGFSGWTLDWQIIDWLVPAGAYSLENATPMDAIKRIAETAGAFVQTHRTALTLAIVHRYPILPWNWAFETPDVSLPFEVIEAINSEWIEKPAYDGVYVSGQNIGANALVKRDGLPGTNLAPMVVDQLITHQDANRSRGAAILGDTGNQQRYSISLALFPEFGVIEPGQLVQIEDDLYWKAICRGNTVDIQWQGYGGLTINQTIELERHYG